MEYSINKIPRPVRRRLKRVMQKSKDTKYARRAQAILLLHEYKQVSMVARILHAARSAIYDWRNRFEKFGEAGLVPDEPGRKPYTTSEEVCAHLLTLIDKEPSDYGYLPSRWSTEMLAKQVAQDLGIQIHASTVRRLLPKLGVRWKRARPTLCIKDPGKTAKMKAITRALNNASEQTPVFYVDEVDVDFSPRIGNGWMKNGKQTAIPPPARTRNAILSPMGKQD